MVYAPAMDYETLDLNEFILTLGMPDLIIGSSMGGYVADIIGSRLGVDVLLFNPALHSRTIPVNHEYYGNTYKRTIVLGTEDKVINPELTKKLWSVHRVMKQYMMKLKVWVIEHHLMFLSICIINMLNYDQINRSIK